MNIENLNPAVESPKDVIKKALTNWYNNGISDAIKIVEIHSVESPELISRIVDAITRIKQNP